MGVGCPGFGYGESHPRRKNGNPVAAFMAGALDRFGVDRRQPFPLFSRIRGRQRGSQLPRVHAGNSAGLGRSGHAGMGCGTRFLAYAIPVLFFHGDCDVYRNSVLCGPAMAGRGRRVRNGSLHRLVSPQQHSGSMGRKRDRTVTAIKEYPITGLK